MVTILYQILEVIARVNIFLTKILSAWKVMIFIEETFSCHGFPIFFLDVITSKTP